MSSLWENHQQASLSDLLAYADVASEDTAKVFDYEEERNKAKISRIEDENKMRKKFFKWASKLTIWIIIGNFFIFAGYLTILAIGLNTAPEKVMLTWIAATIIEIIGIVAIIARHLFPGKRHRQRPAVNGKH